MINQFKKLLFWKSLSAILCFIASGMDLATAIIRFSEGRWEVSLVFVLIGVWCFLAGYVNFRSIYRFIREILND